MQSIRSQAILAKLFPGLASMLCRVVDSKIPVLNESLAQIVQWTSPNVTVQNPTV
jgi:hypothetical protein